MDSRDVGAFWNGNAESWTQLSRAGHDVYRDRVNTPAFLNMLPPVDGLTGLDIGCGEGTNTRAVAALGAKMHGVDIAEVFVRHAKARETSDPKGVTFVHGDALALPFAENHFDFATAFMSLMDVPQPARALVEAFRIVKPGGFLQFSILHPCFVPPRRKTLRDENGDCFAIEIGDYFKHEDGRLEEWTFSSIPKDQRDRHENFKVPRFHRTLTEWVDSIFAAGFALEKLGEPKADDETARAWPSVADTQVTPIFLHFRARKPIG